MKKKFVAFEEFTKQMLPHEIAYLLEVQSFEDNERLAILERMKYNCEPFVDLKPFDDRIDKRKYSHLKNWIQQKLDVIDVDKEYEWLSKLDFEATTGTINSSSEQAILKKIEQSNGPVFHFIKWYDLLRNYRQLLLTSMRYRPYGIVLNYLKERQEQYQATQQRMEQLHLALLDIVQYYNAGVGKPDKWEDWLNNIYYDSQLDGQSRHLALIRLSILHVATRNFDKLYQILAYQEECLLRGEMYSRRILITYYSNQLILCNRKDKLEEAKRFGYLSLRDEYPGSLQYRSNLAAVLLRLNFAEEANQLLKVAFPKMKKSEQAHDKVNFVGMYLRSLVALNQYSQAERYADSFFKGHKEMLLEQGWHFFFQIWFSVLLKLENNFKILRLIKKYQLLEREVKQEKEGNLLPYIQWYSSVASYMEQKIGGKLMIKQIQHSITKIEHQALERSLEYLKREVGSYIELELKELTFDLQSVE